MENRDTEEKDNSPVAESNQDENVLVHDLGETSRLSQGQENANRPDTIASATSELTSQNMPSRSRTDSETGEIINETSESSNLLTQGPDLIRTLESFDDTPKRTDIFPAEAETSSTLKGTFSVLSGTVSIAKPLGVVEDKDVGIDEIVVANPSRPSLTNDATTSTELNYWTFSKDLKSRTQSAASGDILPDHGVYVSEAQIATDSDEKSSNVSRYDINLRKFLKYTASEKKSLPLEVGAVKCEHKKVLFKKTIKSDGAISDIFLCCGINRIASVFKKMKLRKISKSAPSFSDYPSSAENKDLEDKIIPGKEKSCLNVNPQSLTFSGNKCEKTDFESRTKIEIAADSDKSEIKHTNDARSLQDLKSGTSKTVSQNVFKVPVPQNSGKSSKSQLIRNSELSPGTSEFATVKSPSDSPRRPGNFNISPRQSFYTFCPDSPSLLLRQCRSLPNMSQPPKKDPRRSSMNFDYREVNSSVKALFTNELPISPISPDSIDDTAENFMPESKMDNSSNASKCCSQEQQTSDLKSFSENTISNMSNLSNISKTRKKLIFVSPCENTNEIQTLQESSFSSLDISGSISNLRLTESEDSGLKVPLVESPPSKRKNKSSNFSIGDCSDIPSKKVRTSFEPEEITSESTQVTDEKPRCKRKHSEDKGILKPGREELPTCSGSGDTKTDRGPIIEFPEESEGCSKSKRGKIVRVMSPDAIEDITNASLDGKRKEE